LWALAFLRIARHSSPFNATLFQLFTPKILMSYHTHSSHLNLGLPTFLTPSGLVLSTFLIIFRHTLKKNSYLKYYYLFNRWIHFKTKFCWINECIVFL
jgi:hypothetical protein